MLNKQFGALNIVILAALLGSSIVIGLAVLFFLDRALLSRTASQRDHPSLRSTPATQTTNIGGTVIFEVAPGRDRNSLGGAFDPSSIRPGDINPTKAREALQKAPGKTIQKAVQQKTGKTVSLSNIEKARQKGLSSDGQRKISEAFKRRDEVDLSKIRDRLNQ